MEAHKVGARTRKERITLIIAQNKRKSCYVRTQKFTRRYSLSAWQMNTCASYIRFIKFIK